RIKEAAKGGVYAAASLFDEVSGEDAKKLETWLTDAGMSSAEVAKAKGGSAGVGGGGGAGAAAKGPARPTITAGGRDNPASQRRHDEVADLRNQEKRVIFTPEDFFEHGYSPADVRPGDLVSGDEWVEDI